MLLNKETSTRGRKLFRELKRKHTKIAPLHVSLGRYLFPYLSLYYRFFKTEQFYLFRIKHFVGMLRDSENELLQLKKSCTEVFRLKKSKCFLELNYLEFTF